MEWTRAILPSVRHAWGARRRRTLLLALAVALATALVSALSAALSTAEANIDAQVRRSLGSADARVVHEHAADFGAEAIATAAALPGVRAVRGVLQGALTLVRADGAVGEDGKPLRATAAARGVDATRGRAFRSERILEGRTPEAADEILLDGMAQRGLAARVGDELLVQRLGEPVRLRVSGIYERPRLGALQRPHVQMLRGGLAEALGRGDKVGAVSIVLEEGVEAQPWIEEHKGAFKPPLILEPTELASAGISRAVGAGGLMLAIVTSVSVLACSFIVATGMTTAVQQQRRELAIQRMVGATRTQILAGQLAAGLSVGVAGALAGMPLGLGIAWAAIRWWVPSLPEGFTTGDAVAWALGAGVCAALLGAALPAFLAARTSPREAFAARGRPPGTRGTVAFAVGGAALLLAQVSLLSLADPQDRFWTYILAGIPCIFVGWFLLCVGIFGIVAAACSGAVERVLGLPGGLLRGAARSQPWRLGLTAGALMVGLAIFVEGRTNGPALLDDLTGRVRFADAFVFRAGGLDEAEQAAIRAHPLVSKAVAVGYLPLRVGTGAQLGVLGISPPNVVCVGFEPEEFFALNRIDWIEGSPEEALPLLKSGEGVLVAKEFLSAHGISLGETIELGSARATRPFRVAGIVGSAGLDVATQFFGIRSVYMEHAVSCVFMDFEAVGRHFGSKEATIMQVQLPPGATEADEERLADEVADAVPGAVFASGRSLRTSILDAGHIILTISAVASMAALLLASLAVGGVVSAGIAARRGEFGILAACGASRSVGARLVLGECALVGIAAAIAGAGLGSELAWIGRIFLRDLAGLSVSASVPAGAIAIGAGIVLALTLAAAVPAVAGLLRQSPRDLLASARWD